MGSKRKYNNSVESLHFLDSPVVSINQKEKKHMQLPDYRFNWLDVFVVLISMGTYLADIVTDILVMLVYWKINELTWAALTLTFFIVPAIIMQVFSTRWYVADGHKLTFSLAIIHILMMGPMKRYISVLHLGFKARRSKRIHDYQLMYSELSDVSMLRLFECFLESAPQLVLQLHIMIRVEEGDHILTGVGFSLKYWTTFSFYMLLQGISACFSLLSLSWAIVAYTKALRAAASKRKKVSWAGVALQTIWRVGMVLGRITAIVLFATAFQEWTLLILGLHWLMMTGWVVAQDTDFCNTWWEERLFNIVIGVIYVFCFFNMKEGKSRWRLTFYYTVILIENSVMILLWWPQKTIGMWYNIPALIAVWGGFFLGVCCMVLYYIYFHPASKRRCHCCTTWHRVTYFCQTWKQNPVKADGLSPYKKGRSGNGRNDFSSSESSAEEVDYRDFTDLRCSYDTPTTLTGAVCDRKPVCSKHLVNPRHTHFASDNIEEPTTRTENFANFRNIEAISKDGKPSIAIVGDARKGFRIAPLQPQHSDSDPNAKSSRGLITMPLPKATSTPGDDLKNVARAQSRKETPTKKAIQSSDFCVTPKSHKPRSPNTLVKNWVKRTQEMYENEEGCFSGQNKEVRANQLELSLIRSTAGAEKRGRNLLTKSFSKRDRLNFQPVAKRANKKRKKKTLRNSFREAFGFNVIDLDEDNAQATTCDNHELNEQGQRNLHECAQRKVGRTKNTGNVNANVIKHRFDEPPTITEQKNIRKSDPQTHETKTATNCVTSRVMNDSVSVSRKAVSTKGAVIHPSILAHDATTSMKDTCETSFLSQLSSKYYTPAGKSYVYPPSKNNVPVRKKLAFKQEENLSRSAELLNEAVEDDAMSYRMHVDHGKKHVRAIGVRKTLGSIENQAV